MINLLFRWAVVGLRIDDQVWVPTVFTKNRNRLAVERHPCLDHRPGSLWVGRQTPLTPGGRTPPEGEPLRCLQVDVPDWTVTDLTCSHEVLLPSCQTWRLSPPAGALNLVARKSGDRTMSNLFWLTEAQMARLEPFFPKSHGEPRVDDRRLLSGIIFINRNGLRWRDAPREYGPPKTLYNRWKRWSDKGVFARMMDGLAAELPPRRR